MQAPNRESCEANSNKRYNVLALNILDELLEPSPLEAKHKIKIKVLEGCGFINLTHRHICSATMRGSFKVKSPMDPIL